MTTMEKLNIKYRDELEILTIQMLHYERLSKENKIEEAARQHAYYTGLYDMLSIILMRYCTNRSGYYLMWIPEKNNWQVVRQDRM